jgi:hypothetical protein
VAFLDGFRACYLLDFLIRFLVLETLQHAGALMLGRVKSSKL